MTHILATSQRVAFPWDDPAATSAVRDAPGWAQRVGDAARTPEDLASWILDMVMDRFRINEPGNVAAPRLTAVLANLAHAASDDPLEGQRQVREHLNTCVDQMVNAPAMQEIGKLDCLAYLASLYGETALLHSSFIVKEYRVSQSLKRWLDRADLYVDEALAHRVYPRFVYMSMPHIERFMDPRFKEAEQFLDFYGRDPDVAELRTIVRSEYLPVPERLLTAMFERIQSKRA